MIDMSYVSANRHDLEFEILGKTGIWKYSRSYGDARSMRYTFQRFDNRGNKRKIETSLSYKQVQEKVFTKNGKDPEFKVTDEMLQAPLAHMRYVPGQQGEEQPIPRLKMWY